MKGNFEAKLYFGILIYYWFGLSLEKMVKIYVIVSGLEMGGRRGV